MSWSPGTKLGPYEIVAPLGSGGMGEVHRARDTRLNREVAIKAIPALLAGDEQIRQRFEREARAISSLNHPHICTLYDVGHAPGPSEAKPLLYLVMELIDGESLADRLVKGPLPVHEVLKYGRQIASALEAAHRQGIVHRDLKPANVMLTRTGAKLLDFGLARAAAGDAPPIRGLTSGSSLVQTAMAPEPRPLTAEGTILGTFQYMAPEQLEGSTIDARTDIFALGSLLYEMATGMRPFQGNSRTGLIAAIVSSQPAPMVSVAPATPPALEHVVRRCMEKDPDDRWQSAHDVAAELQWIGESGSQSQAGVVVAHRPRLKTREWIAWGLAGMLALTSVWLGAFQARPAPAAKAFRATLAPPSGQALIPFDEMGLALSPDGRTLVFGAAGADGRRTLWVRSLAEMNARQIPETTGASYPFWSPDGQHIGFFAELKLKSVDLRGGSPRVLADAPTGRGGSWSRDDVILFAPNISSPIHNIPAAGGVPKPVTRYEPGTEVTHRWPHFLPDGRRFLYLSRARATGKGEVGRLMLASLDSPEGTVLIEDATNAQFVEPGYLIYGRAANLYAWRWEGSAARLEGQAFPIIQERLSYWEAKNFVPFAASADGTIVYLPDAIRTTEMRWYDRQGRPLGAVGGPGYHITPRISPDGRKILYMHAESPQSLNDIWVRDLEYDRAFRVSQQSGLYAAPAWAPDSDRVAFLCQPKGVQDICLTSLKGGGEIKILHESATWKDSGSWMPDGKRLLFGVQDPETNFDIMMLPAEGGQPVSALRTPFQERDPQVSPDGRRMAFVSNQTGRPEVYVRNLDGSAGQWQISSDGAYEPRWRADGKELFYAATDGALMAVSMQEGTELRPGGPVSLFDMPEHPEPQAAIFSDVTPDGQRFLLNVPTTSRGSIGFHVVGNWTALPQGGGRPEPTP